MHQHLLINTSVFINTKVNGSGLPRAMQGSLRQEHLWVSGSRHTLTGRVLFIVSLMGHVTIGDCLPNIRENFRIKSCKSCCRRGLSRYVSHYLFFCVYSCTRCRFSSKLGVYAPRRKEGLWSKAVCASQKNLWLTRKEAHPTVNQSCFNAGWSIHFLLHRTWSLPLLHNAMSLGRG